MKILSNFFLGVLLVIVFSQCSPQPENNEEAKEELRTSKPYARYWWFASEIKKEDVNYNLDWLKAMGFGGVELAFVYPLNSINSEDTTYTPRQEWLGEDLKKIIKYTVNYADSIGLGCDITFGTLWPFNDSKVTFGQATQRFGDSEWRQDVTRSWEYPKKVYVVDHLTPVNYMPYFNRMIDFLPQTNIKKSQAYFIDSWEVETQRLWCDNFDSDFEKFFGYDIVPFMDSIYQPAYSDYLYDYMSLLSNKVLKFYADFDSTLNANGKQSRGQVSGAPCDLISGYALMDIPEGEAMLFEPEFSSIPASAALLAEKKIVSSETFTCLYGWPDDYIREEQTADLKLVADALFANGVNHIIWHGKAHNPAGIDSVNFYASVHLGDEGKLVSELRTFNSYLEKISSYMRKGNTFSDIAVYLPTEDAWKAGTMPKEKQFIWAWGYYEMRYVYFPEELKGFNPTWINGEFLDKAQVENGDLKVGNARYKALYIDSKYLDYKVVKRLAELASAGLSVILKQTPQEPGINKHSDYNDLIRKITEFSNVVSEIPGNEEVFIEGDSVPEHWCRKEGETLFVFFANPKSKRLTFPIEYGQSYNNETKTFKVRLNYLDDEYDLELVFKPYQSLLYKIEKGVIQPVDISFTPEVPEIKSRPEDYKAPWLVE